MVKMSSLRMRFALAFSDSKHLGAANGANPLSSRSSILHGNTLGVLHFLLGFTFHTVCLHRLPPSIVFSELKLLVKQSQQARM